MGTEMYYTICLGDGRAWAAPLDKFDMIPKQVIASAAIHTIEPRGEALKRVVAWVPSSGLSQRRNV